MLSILLLLIPPESQTLSVTTFKDVHTLWWIMTEPTESNTYLYYLEVSSSIIHLTHTKMRMDTLYSEQKHSSFCNRNRNASQVLCRQTAFQGCEVGIRFPYIHIITIIFLIFPFWQYKQTHKWNDVYYHTCKVNKHFLEPSNNWIRLVSTIPYLTVLRTQVHKICS